MCCRDMAHIALLIDPIPACIPLVCSIAFAELAEDGRSLATESNSDQQSKTSQWCRLLLATGCRAEFVQLLLNCHGFRG